jgi:hypothetical protein
MDKPELVKQCAEERSQLQWRCIEGLDLNTVEKKKGLGKLKFYYDKCVKENAHLYLCLEKSDASIKY